MVKLNLSNRELHSFLVESSSDLKQKVVKKWLNAKMCFNASSFCSNYKHEPVIELRSNLELVDLWLLSSVFKCVGACVVKIHGRAAAN